MSLVAEDCVETGMRRTPTWFFRKYLSWQRWSSYIYMVSWLKFCDFISQNWEESVFRLPTFVGGRLTLTRQGWLFGSFVTGTVLEDVLKRVGPPVAPSPVGVSERKRNEGSVVWCDPTLCCSWVYCVTGKENQWLQVLYPTKRKS